MTKPQNKLTQRTGSATRLRAHLFANSAALTKRSNTSNMLTSAR